MKDVVSAMARSLVKKGGADGLGRQCCRVAAAQGGLPPAVHATEDPEGRGCQDGGTLDHPR